MTTTATVHAAIKSRLAAQLPAVTFRYQNETTPLPATPATYVFIELNVLKQNLVGWGGGRFANLYRSDAFILALVLVPISTAGVDAGLQLAEQVATVFRSYRDADISCVDATVRPEAGRTEEGNYTMVASVEVTLTFDQIG